MAGAVHEKVIAAATSSQSHLIVGAVLLAFVVWVTLQGNLGKYLTYLGFGTPAPAPAPPVSPGAGGAIGGAIPGAAIGLGGLNFPGIPSLPPIPNVINN